MTASGQTMPISQLSIGQQVMSVDSDGHIIYSPILSFLDWNPDQMSAYYSLTTASGKTITLTPTHLIYVIISNNNDNDINENKDKYYSSTILSPKLAWTPLFAKEVREGDRILISPGMLSITSLSSFSSINDDDNESRYTFKNRFLDQNDVGNYEDRDKSDADFSDDVNTNYVHRHQYLHQNHQHQPSLAVGDHAISDRVVSITVSTKKGVYAPMTLHGTIVVDGVVASCYAFIHDEQLAHNVFAPIRALHWLKTLFSELLLQFSQLTTWIGHVFSHQQMPYSPSVSFASPSSTVSHIFHSTNTSSSSISLSNNERIEANLGLDSKSMEGVQQHFQDGAHWYAQLLYSVAINVLGMDIQISM